MFTPRTSGQGSFQHRSCPTLSLQNTTTTFFTRIITPINTMAGKYELLCLENPLLDIQGVG
jgi:hypothetical protein